MWCRLTGARQPVWTRGLRCSLLPVEDDLRVSCSLRESSSPSLRNLLRLLRLTSGPALLPSLQRIRSLSPGLDEECSLQPASETSCPRRGGANVAAHCALYYVPDFSPVCTTLQYLYWRFVRVGALSLAGAATALFLPRISHTHTSTLKPNASTQY